MDAKGALDWFKEAKAESRAWHANEEEKKRQDLAAIDAARNKTHLEVQGLANTGHMAAQGLAGQQGIDKAILTNTLAKPLTDSQIATQQAQLEHYNVGTAGLNLANEDTRLGQNIIQGLSPEKQLAYIKRDWAALNAPDVKGVGIATPEPKPTIASLNASIPQPTLISNVPAPVVTEQSYLRPSDYTPAAVHRGDSISKQFENFGQSPYQTASMPTGQTAVASALYPAGSAYNVSNDEAVRRSLAGAVASPAQALETGFGNIKKKVNPDGTITYTDR